MAFGAVVDQQNRRERDRIDLEMQWTTRHRGFDWETLGTEDLGGLADVDRFELTVER